MTDINAVMAELKAAGLALQESVSPTMRIRVSPAMEAEIKLWRHRRGIVSEAEALRRLLRAGLDARTA